MNLDAYERTEQIQRELMWINRVPEEARELLDREMGRLLAYHTEKCCDLKLSAEESAAHKEARQMARGLHAFFEKRKKALQEELYRLRLAGRARPTAIAGLPSAGSAG